MKTSGVLLAMGWAMFALQGILVVLDASSAFVASAFSASQIHFAASLVCMEIEKRNNRTND